MSYADEQDIPVRTRSPTPFQLWYIWILVGVLIQQETSFNLNLHCSKLFSLNAPINLDKLSA